jgi:hypothetical protein
VSADEINQLWADAGDKDYALQMLLGCPIKEVGRFYVDEDGDLSFRGKIKDTLWVVLQHPLCTLKALRWLVGKKAGKVIADKEEKCSQ